MGNLKTEMLTKLKGLAPFEQILAIYEDKSLLFRELHNYMIGGMVASNPSYFMMCKAIDGSKDASDQWFCKNPDTWYVRWVLTDGTANPASILPTESDSKLTCIIGSLNIVLFCR